MTTICYKAAAEMTTDGNWLLNGIPVLVAENPADGLEESHLGIIPRNDEPPYSDFLYAAYERDNKEIKVIQDGLVLTLSDGEEVRLELFHE